MSTLRGETVDRPPVCFYEISGFDEHPEDPDPFNIFSDPSWLPLIELARDKTDRIVLRSVLFEGAMPDAVAELTTTDSTIRDGSRFSISTLRAAGRTLTSRTRRDPSIKTVWTEEHLLKDIEIMPTDQFAEKVKTALSEGTHGEGRGMVLMPSASPYGRQLADLSLKNYEKIIELAEQF